MSSEPKTEFTVVIEDAGSSFAAYAPDVPGCIVIRLTIDDVTSTLREAIFEHLTNLRQMGEEIPVPHSSATVSAIAF